MLLFMFDINPCSIFLSLSSSIYCCHSISAVNSKVLKLKIVFPIKDLSKFHYRNNGNFSSPTFISMLSNTEGSTLVTMIHLGSSSSSPETLSESRLASEAEFGLKLRLLVAITISSMSSKESNESWKTREIKIVFVNFITHKKSREIK